MAVTPQLLSREGTRSVPVHLSLEGGTFLDVVASSRLDGVVPDIRTKRVWDPHEPSDGARFLIDGRWPPGVRHDSLRIVLWVRDAAPSRKLMKRLRANPQAWTEFKRRYFAELDENPDGWEPIARQARLGPVTLIYTMRDRRHNNAVALADYLTSLAS